MQDVLLLGIETSCDETAAALVRNGREVLSNVISSQVAIHAEFGGVVPEIASRNHLEKIDEVIRLAMKEAEVSFSDLDGIAVTGRDWSVRFWWAFPMRRHWRIRFPSRSFRYTILKDILRQIIFRMRIANRLLSVLWRAEDTATFFW